MTATTFCILKTCSEQKLHVAPLVWMIHILQKNIFPTELFSAWMKSERFKKLNSAVCCSEQKSIVEKFMY